MPLLRLDSRLPFTPSPQNYSRCLLSPHLVHPSGTPGLVAVDGDREVQAEIKEWISNHPIGPLKVSTCGMNGFILDLASVCRVEHF